MSGSRREDGQRLTPKKASKIDRSHPTLGVRVQNTLVGQPAELEMLLARLCRMDTSEEVPVHLDTRELGYDLRSQGGRGVWILDRRAGCRRTYADKGDRNLPGTVDINLNPHLSRHVLMQRGWRVILGHHYPDRHLRMVPPRRLCKDCPHLLSCTLEGTIGG